MNPETTQIIVIILGVLASIGMVTSGMTTNRRKLLLLLSILSILGISQYLLLGVVIALATSLVNLTRTTLLFFFEKRFPILSGLPVAFLFMSLHLLAFSFATNQFLNPLTIFDYIPLVGAFLGTLAFVFRNMVIVKSLMLTISIMWVMYEFMIGAYGQMLGETFTIFANIVAIIYLVRKHSAGLTDDQIPDLTTQVIQTITTPIDIQLSGTLTGSVSIVRK